jgi:tRNA pseudouridine38-40 synthase
MRTIKLTLEYDGSRYAGWQIQSRHPCTVTIQETLERTLKKILREDIRVTGSGRTDAGVSALGQAASFSTGSRLPLFKIKNALNALLPGDIVVTRIESAAADFCACTCAKSKVYRYLIANSPHPSAVLRQNVHYCVFPLNLAHMRREAAALVGTHDFKAFCASGSSAKTTVRTVKRVTIKKIPYFPLFGVSMKAVRRSRWLIAIDIEADGFLYTMVRTIAGTLVEIGRGRFPRGSIRAILRSEDRKKAGPTLPAQGLYLLGVNY